MEQNKKYIDKEDLKRWLNEAGLDLHEPQSPHVIAERAEALIKDEQLIADYKQKLATQVPARAEMRRMQELLHEAYPGITEGDATDVMGYFVELIRNGQI